MAGLVLIQCGSGIVNIKTIIAPGMIGYIYQWMILQVVIDTPYCKGDQLWNAPWWVSSKEQPLAIQYKSFDDDIYISRTLIHVQWKYTKNSNWYAKRKICSKFKYRSGKNGDESSKVKPNSNPCITKQVETYQFNTISFRTPHSDWVKKITYFTKWRIQHKITPSPILLFCRSLLPTDNGSSIVGSLAVWIGRFDGLIIDVHGRATADHKAGLRPQSGPAKKTARMSFLPFLPPLTELPIDLRYRRLHSD